jgi:hypothetical protein
MVPAPFEFPHSLAPLFFRQTPLGKEHFVVPIECFRRTEGVGTELGGVGQVCLAKLTDAAFEQPGIAKLKGLLQSRQLVRVDVLTCHSKVHP